MENQCSWPSHWPLAAFHVLVSDLQHLSGLSPACGHTGSLLSNHQDKTEICRTITVSAPSLPYRNCLQRGDKRDWAQYSAEMWFSITHTQWARRKQRKISAPPLAIDNLSLLGKGALSSSLQTALCHKYSWAWTQTTGHILYTWLINKQRPPVTALLTPQRDAGLLSEWGQHHVLKPGREMLQHHRGTGRLLILTRERKSWLRVRKSCSE